AASESFSRLAALPIYEYVSGSAGLIPLLAGYRHSFGNFYAEGQLGLTVVRTSVKFKGSSDIPGLGGLGGSASDTNLGDGIGGGRSEEHTSELQSRENL